MRTNIKKLAAAILAAALILGNGTVVFADSAIAPATELKTETIRFADVADKAEESSPAVKAIRRSEKALREQDVTEEIEGTDQALRWTEGSLCSAGHGARKRRGTVHDSCRRRSRQ